MLIKCLTVGNMEANCYIVADEETLTAAVIDPGDESNTILDYIEDMHLKVEAIFLTHGHFDHTGAANTVSEETGAPIWINKNDEALTPGGLFKFFPDAPVKHYSDGNLVHVGPLLFGILDTPGHSPGSVTIMTETALFTGDTLFKNACGRTDLDGGDIAALGASLRRLAALESDYEIYPGHMDPTTLERERRFNPFIRAAMGIK